MKLFLVLIIVLTGCVSTPAPYQPIADVLDAPEQFNDRIVRVCGWFVSDMETCTLSSSAAATSTVVPGSDVVWVLPATDICTPINAYRKPMATWAVLEGTFRTDGNFGHFGLYHHTLIGGTATPVRACGGDGSAPNNSSKPTPLRGAA